MPRSISGPARPSSSDRPGLFRQFEQSLMACLDRPSLPGRLIWANHQLDGGAQKEFPEKTELFLTFLVDTAEQAPGTGGIFSDADPFIPVGICTDDRGCYSHADRLCDDERVRCCPRMALKACEYELVLQDFDGGVTDTSCERSGSAVVKNQLVMDDHSHRTTTAQTTMSALEPALLPDVRLQRSRTAN